MSTTFLGCPPEGSGRFDRELNRLKNRADTSEHYIPATLAELARLPWPLSIGYGYRVRWTPAQRAAVARVEGIPVVVEAHIVALRRIPPEPTNCGARREEMRDYHLWLHDAPRGSARGGVVAEVTPRFRAVHPGWTLARLDSLRAAGARVRVSGWLLLDNLHPELVGIRRSTLWEIHPITRIEVRGADGAWVVVE
jgi:hypothetical protein